MGLKWIGRKKGQQGIPGIPGRDLSDGEIERRGLDRAFLLKTGLYIEKKKPRKKMAAKEE